MVRKEFKIEKNFLHSKFFRMRKIFYGILVNFLLTFLTVFYTSFLLQIKFFEDVQNLILTFIVIFITRQIVSFTFFDDYKLSWSKASTWTAYLKFFHSTISFIIYFSIFRIFTL